MTDPQNKVPFFLAGEGAYLRFRLADLVVLREKYGEPAPVKVRNELGFDQDAVETFMDRLNTRVAVSDPVAILDCLRAGLKQADGRKPYAGISFDDPPFGIADARKPIIDALVLGVTGKDYATLLEEQKERDAIEERNARLREKGAIFDGDEDPDPQETLMDSTSSSEPSGSDTKPGS